VSQGKFCLTLRHEKVIKGGVGEKDQKIGGSRSVRNEGQEKGGTITRNPSTDGEARSSGEIHKKKGVRNQNCKQGESPTHGACTRVSQNERVAMHDKLGEKKTETKAEGDAPLGGAGEGQ